MKSSRKILKSFAAFTAGAITLLFFLEAGLRLFHRFRPQPPATYTSIEQTTAPAQSLIHIVTLGESTSESTHENGIDVSWPAQLELKLNEYLAQTENPLRVRVTNLARSGTFSVFQVTALQNIFSDHPPDIIVSMLGINDSGRLQVGRNSLYESSYVVRLIYWSIIAYQCPNCYLRELGRSNANVENPTRADNIVRRSSQELISKFRFHLDKKTSENRNRRAFNNYKDELAALRSVDREAEHILNAESAVQLFSIAESAGFESANPNLCREILSFALDLMTATYDKTVLKEISYVQHLCHIRFRLNGGNCLADLKKAIQNGVPVTYSLLKMSAVQEGVQDDPFFQSLFQGVGFDINRNSIEPRVTQNSYRAIGDFATRHGITWFAMQYPTGSVEGIRQYLGEDTHTTSKSFADGFYQFKETTRILPQYKEVVFVSNENFRSLVSFGNDREYFKDLFGMRRGLQFGHTTAKGHSVIAENVFREIIKNWKNIEQRRFKK